MYIKCASSEEIKKAIPETCSFIESMGSDSGCMIISSREVSSSLVQKYIYFKGTKIYESLVKPIVLDAAIKAETHAASSGDLCLALISLMTKRRIKISNLLKIASSIEDQKISKRTNRKDVIRAIEALFSDSFQRKFLKEVLDNSNSLTPIFLERTNLKNSQIRVSSGYNFKISVDQEYLNEGAWSFKNVNCYVIDGHIESVGEIHHLLEKASDSREPYIVFARDASKDVISTIQYNFKR
ncbi:hypothetical protein CL634_02400, partial [bacterium]|nr:hypothetical protein [bacterium]